MGKVVGSVMNAVGLGGPEAPDPNATAAAQTNANRAALWDSAKINQMGINMPGYDISYTGTIGQPDRTMHFNLSPEKQALTDILYGGVEDIGSQMQFMPDFSGVPALPGTGDYSADAQRVEDMTFDAIMNRLRPEQDRLIDNSITRLNVTGNPSGSELYDYEMGNIYEGIGDQNLQAALSAVNAGRAEHSRLFDVGMRGHQQGMSDVMAKNQMPLSNLAQLLALDPTNVNQPGMPTYQMAPPDIMGATMAKYNADASTHNAMLGGLAGLGGAAILASDRRLKHNLVPRGTLANGIPVYEFSYNGYDDRHMGVMAQDVMKVMPEAVSIMDNGYMAVDYGMIQ